MSSRIPVFWDWTLHQGVRGSVFVSSSQTLFVLHFLCLFLHYVIHFHMNSVSTSFSIFTEIISSLTFLHTVYIAYVAVHIFCLYGGQDFSVSVLNRLQNLQSRNHGLIIGSVTKFSVIYRVYPVGTEGCFPQVEMAGA
jgi:hypothetical protein